MRLRLEVPSLPSALVAGGTGMLAAGVSGLVGEGRMIVVAARRAERAQFPEPAGEAPARGRILPLNTDYSDAKGFDAALRVASTQSGQFGMAVLWIHTPHAEPVFSAVAKVMTSGASVFHVLGSAASDPARRPPVPTAFLGPHVTYHRVSWPHAPDASPRRTAAEAESPLLLLVTRDAVVGCPQGVHSGNRARLDEEGGSWTPRTTACARR